jgi:hypothetical protein
MVLGTLISADDAKSSDPIPDYQVPQKSQKWPKKASK